MSDIWNRHRASFRHISSTVCFTDFGQLNLAYIRNGGLVLDLRYFLLLTQTQVPQKAILASKIAKKDSRIIISISNQNQ
jgi:hypothetical protein